MAKNGSAAKKRDVHVVTEIVEVPVAVSAEELAKHNEAWLKISEELDLDEAKARRERKVFNEDRKEKKLKHDELRSIVKSKAAPKRLRCRIEYDFERGEVRHIDAKTEKLVYTREMTKEDHKLGIGGTAPEKTGGPAGADKPPPGEKGKRLTGTTKKGELDKPAAADTFPPPRPEPMY